MGLAQEFQTGNKSEWSLIRRHPSERKFGIQLCGNRPQTLVAATEAICKEVSDLDFIDVNLGCPIDLVVKKGAGSALLDHAGKLGRILKGMSYAAGDVPITIKMRTGIKTGVNTTHKLMPRAVKDWGVGALTVRVGHTHYKTSI
jgi:tRNA-dihydrouridine synthase 3